MRVGQIIKNPKLINFLFDDDSKPTRYETSDDIKPVILKLASKHFNRHDMISDY